MGSKLDPGLPGFQLQSLSGVRDQGQTVTATRNIGVRQRCQADSWDHSTWMKTAYELLEVIGRGKQGLPISQSFSPEEGRCVWLKVRQRPKGGPGHQNWTETMRFVWVQAPICNPNPPISHRALKSTALTLLCVSVAFLLFQCVAEAERDAEGQRSPRGKGQKGCLPLGTIALWPISWPDSLPHL